MMSMNSKPPTAPERTEYKLIKNNRKKITDANAIMSAAGQYAQRFLDRYENHVEVETKSGITQRSIAPRPMYFCATLAISPKQ